MELRIHKHNTHTKQTLAAPFWGGFLALFGVIDLIEGGGGGFADTEFLLESGDGARLGAFASGILFFGIDAVGVGVIIIAVTELEDLEELIVGAVAEHIL